ncbi:MAG: nucleoid-associated protein [Thiolinea sp.]
MIDISAVQIKKLIVHQIGNQSRDEGYVLSKHEANRSAALDELLIRNYLMPLIRQGHPYDFHHESDLSLNTIYHFSGLIFDNPDTFNVHSQSIAKHLYSASTHPNIGGGEFIVILFDNLLTETGPEQALGFFRIEGKSDYLDVQEIDESFSVVERIGISLEKIQKGAITLSGGKRVYVVDSLGQKTKYWMNSFLKAALSETPKNCAKAAGNFLKAVSDKVESTDQALAFSQGLDERLAGGDEISMGEIRHLSERYLSEEQVSELLDDVREKAGLGINDDLSIDSRELDRYTRNVRTRARLADGVNVVVSQGKAHIAAVDVEQTEDGLRAVIDIKLLNREAD